MVGSLHSWVTAAATAASSAAAVTVMPCRVHSSKSYSTLAPVRVRNWSTRTRAASGRNSPLLPPSCTARNISPGTARAGDSSSVTTTSAASVGCAASAAAASASASASARSSSARAARSAA